MQKICDNCIYCYKPTSISDYFKKTLQMPNLCEWGIDVFKHKFWLCSSSNVSEVDHINDSLIYKPCQQQNFKGNCAYFKTSSAININPSAVSIDSTIPEFVTVDADFSLEVTVTPADESNISYSYQWYKNDRKLYKETSSTITVDTSEVAIDEYYCEVTQDIEQNGDGGEKQAITYTNAVAINIVESE